jgi:hypothetical protein
MTKEIIIEECYGGVLQFIFTYEEEDTSYIDFIASQDGNKVCEGYLKWDGCINIDWIGADHFCGYENMIQVLSKIPVIIYLYGVSKIPVLKEYGKIENLIK